MFDDISSEQWEDVVMFIENSDEMDLHLLACLDRAVDLEKGMEKFFSGFCHVVNEFTALNSNIDICSGKLIPKYMPKWKKIKEHTVTELAENPLSILQNYIWIDNREDGDWKIKNFYCPEWKYTGETSFKIVCSPLINEEPFDWKTDDNGEVNYFYVTGYFEDKKDTILKRVENTIDYAARKGADIVLFPEMVAYPELHKSIKKYVHKKWDIITPKIIILPSSEYNKNTKWQDITYALDSSGDEIFEYCKQQPYQLDIEENIGDKKYVVKYFEPIEPDCKISIMHYIGVGRIGVCICSDLFNDKLMNLLFKTYDIDLLLIPSYSEGRDRFERSISNAMDAVCDVVWCNCCAAYVDSKKKAIDRKQPAVSYFPYGHSKLKKSDKAEDYVWLFRCSDCECKKCSECAVTIEISPFY